MKRYVLLLAPVLLVLTLAACDSGVPTDDAATPQLIQLQELENAAGKVAKVYACHVGSEEGDDAGDVDLLSLPRRTLDSHESYSEQHCYDGVCDFPPVLANAEAPGANDDGGTGTDAGCVEGVPCPTLPVIGCTDSDTFPAGAVVLGVYASADELLNTVYACGIETLAASCQAVCGPGPTVLAYALALGSETAYLFCVYN